MSRFSHFPFVLRSIRNIIRSRQESNTNAEPVLVKAVVLMQLQLLNLLP